MKISVEMKMTSVAVVFLTISILLTADCVHSEESDGFLGNFGKSITENIQKSSLVKLKIPQ